MYTYTFNGLTLYFLSFFLFFQSSLIQYVCYVYTGSFQLKKNLATLFESDFWYNHDITQTHPCLPPKVVLHARTLSHLLHHSRSYNNPII